MISDLRNGLSENPPTMKIKLTFSFLASTELISYATLDLIFSNRVLKKEAIRAGGTSTLAAPFNFK